MTSAKLPLPLPLPPSTRIYKPLLYSNVIYSNVMSEDDSRKKVGLFHSISPSHLKPGDHIYSYRALSAYSHHGIFVGEGECQVIYFSGQTKKKSTIGITRRTLKEFCQSEELRLVAYNVSSFAVRLKKRILPQGGKRRCRSCASQSMAPPLQSQPVATIPPHQQQL